MYTCFICMRRARLRWCVVCGASVVHIKLKETLSEIHTIQRRNIFVLYRKTNPIVNYYIENIPAAAA